MARLPRRLGLDELRRLDFLRFDCIHQHLDIAELRLSILTTHSMTYRSLYLAFLTILPRRRDNRAIYTHGSVRLRAHSHGLHRRPGRTYNRCYRPL
jgi:hypothetical protein